MKPTFPMVAPVIVDGNRHKLDKLIRVRLDGPITIIKCREIVRNLELKFGINIGKIEVHLYDHLKFDELYEQVENDDLSPAEFGEFYSKTATYSTKSDCLQIWDNGYPVYENINGVICKDIEALADCLL